jgi:serine protease inhibitor
MHIKNFITLFFISTFFIACFISCNESLVHNEIDTFSYSLNKAEKEILHSSQKFGLKLYKRIVNAQPDSNVFISPLSISTALNMALNGAKGQTYDDMYRTMELDENSLREINEASKTLKDALENLDPEVKLSLANSVWYRDELTFQQTFMQAMVDYYYAHLEGCNFNDPATVTLVNHWVENNTNGMIDKIIDRIEPAEILFLINALYFKGTWQTEFNPESTIQGTFKTSENATAICDMMVQDETYHYFETQDFQSVDLPYGDGNFSMSIFLPKPDKDLNRLYYLLNEDNWNNWLGRYEEKDIRLMMPKFDLQYEIELKDVLAAMGMSIAFGGSADFTNLFAPGGIYIGKVFHKTAIKVNEEGTEAAAVTIIGFERSSANEKPQMIINRPFLYMIRENSTGTILFIGQVIDPSL